METELRIPSLQSISGALQWAEILRCFLAVCLADAPFHNSARTGKVPAAKSEQDRHYTYEGNFEAHSSNNYCRGETIRFTFSECVSVALVIQHVMRMRRVIFSSVACLALPYLAL